MHPNDAKTQFVLFSGSLIAPKSVNAGWAALAQRLKLEYNQPNWVAKSNPMKAGLLAMKGSPASGGLVTARGDLLVVEAFWPASTMSVAEAVAVLSLPQQSLPQQSLPQQSGPCSPQLTSPSDLRFVLVHERAPTPEPAPELQVLFEMPWGRLSSTRTDSANEPLRWELEACPEDIYRELFRQSFLFEWYMLETVACRLQARARSQNQRVVVDLWANDLQRFCDVFQVTGGARLVELRALCQS